MLKDPMHTHPHSVSLNQLVLLILDAVHIFDLSFSSNSSQISVGNVSFYCGKK